MSRRDNITGWIILAFIVGVFFSIRVVNRSRRHQIFQTLDATLTNEISTGDEYSKIASKQVGFWNLRPTYSDSSSLPNDEQFQIQMFTDLDGACISVYCRNDRVFAAVQMVPSGDWKWYIRDDAQLAKCFEARYRKQ